MDFIYTDKNFNELNYLNNANIDIEIGTYATGSNDFELKIPIMYREPLFDEQSLFFANKTEWGGMVTSKEVDTSSMIITYRGDTFRGLLKKEVIQPPINTAYYVAKGEANTIIEQAIKGKFDDLFVVDNVGLSDIKVNYQTRDINLLEFLEKALFYADIPSRLEIRFEDGRVHLQAIPIVDLSELLQYDRSYGVSLIAKTVEKGYNHIVALGKGELTERLRTNLYLKEDGTWSTNTSDSAYKGLKRKTYLYEDTNQEDMNELTNNAIERVKELNGTQTMKINFTSDDAELFEIVGAKEDITGISFKEQITNKILKGSINEQIQNIKIEYKVGD